MHIDQSTCMFNLKLGIYTLVSPFQISPNSCLYQQDACMVQYLILNDTQKEETEERGKNSCMIFLSSQKGK